MKKFDFNINWKTLAKIAICVVIVFLIMRYWGSVEGFFGLLLGGLIAIIAGLIIAYIVNIPMRFFERKLPGPTGDGTRNRTLSLVLSIVCALAVLLIFGILVIPNLVGAIIELANQAPYVLDWITTNPTIASLIPPDLVAQIQSIDWDKVAADVFSWLQSGIMTSLPEITSTFGRIGACFMGIILAFWFLGEKDKLSEGVHVLARTYISKGFDDRFSSMISVADRCFHGYFVGQSLEAVLFGSIVTVASAIAGMPNPLMLGALVGVMSFIPMIGALIGAVLGAIIILPTSWLKALIFLIVFFAMQQVEANFLYPRVVGKQVGLTGMWPLIGVTLGTALLGFPGAFLGVPLTAAIFRIVESDLERRKQLKQQGGEDSSPLQKLHKSLSDKSD